jgi:hypothetical protein
MLIWKHECQWKHVSCNSARLKKNPGIPAAQGSFHNHHSAAHYSLITVIFCRFGCWASALTQRHLSGSLVYSLIRRAQVTKCGTGDRLQLMNHQHFRLMCITFRSLVEKSRKHTPVFLAGHTGESQCWRYVLRRLWRKLTAAYWVRCFRWEPGCLPWGTHERLPHILIGDDECGLWLMRNACSILSDGHTEIN